MVKNIGIMNEIHCDNSLEQVGTNTEIMSKACKYNIGVSKTELHLPFQNKAKNQILIIKGR